CMIKERDIMRALALSFLVFTVGAADYSVKVGDQPPPEKLSKAIRSELSSKPVQLMDGGKPIMQIWLRNEIPLKSNPSSPKSSLNALKEATLVAVISVDQAGVTDYKNNPVPEGVYTARFILQPQDGDHLGTALYSTFVALISAEADQALDSFDGYAPM